MEEKSHSLSQFAHGLIAFSLTYFILWYGSFIFIPLTWGIFFAFALFPVANWFEEKRFPRGMSILLT
nr:AI-2E family transporter [Cytophagales bacterium]